MVEILQKWNCSGNHFCHLSHGRWFPNIFILFENVWQLSPRAEVGDSNGKSFSKFLLSHHSKCHTKIKLENCAKFDFNLRASQYEPPISEWIVDISFFAMGTGIRMPVWRRLQENGWFSVFWFVCLHGFAPNYGCYKMDFKIDILDISQRRNCQKCGGRIFFLLKEGHHVAEP